MTAELNYHVWTSSVWCSVRAVFVVCSSISAYFLGLNMKFWVNSILSQHIKVISGVEEEYQWLFSSLKLGECEWGGSAVRCMMSYQASVFSSKVFHH